MVSVFRLMRFYLCMVVFICNGVLYAQLNPAGFKQYTIHDGLSGNRLTGITQDEQGYIWISTGRGLNRYDGKQFVQFHTGNENNSLPDDNIKGLEWLQPGKLASYTNMGVHIIDTRTGKTSNIIVPGLQQEFTYRYNDVFSVTGDATGNVYILTSSGFYHYNNSNELIFRFDYHKKETVSTNIFPFARKLIWISRNKLYVTGNYEMQIYNTSTKQITAAEGTEPFTFKIDPFAETWQTDRNGFFMFRLMTDTILYFNNVTKTSTASKSSFQSLRSQFEWGACIYPVNDTLFYITARQNGFYKMSLHPKTGKLTIYPEKYFKDYYCTGFLKDRDGRLWITTRDGLFKQNTANNSVKHVSIPDPILKQSPATEIKQLFVYKDNLYAACDNNGGLLVFNKDSLSFIKKISLQKIQPHADDIRSIVYAANDTFIIGTYGPLYWLNSNLGNSSSIELEGWNKYSDFSLAQLKDKDGNIWIATNKKKIYHYLSAAQRFQLYNYQNTVFEKILMPRYIQQDMEGNIWFGGHGLCRINAVTAQPDLYIDSFPGYRFSRKEITGLAIDKNNTLWFGNYANGLVAYHLKTRDFLHFTEADGLAGNIASAVCVVNNHVWVGTTAGVSCINISNQKVSSFGLYDGFPVLPFTSRNFFYDSSNESIYAGFTNRIAKFNANNLIKPSASPKIFIESVQISKDTLYYLPATSVSTAYNKNDLKISVGIICYQEEAGSLQVAYRLTNMSDTAWKMLNGNVINFNDIKPGNHTLQLKLFAANNRWLPQQINFTITVTPPFWKTSWFIAIMSAVLAFTAYALYKWRIFYVRKTEREKARTQELRAEKYKTQYELEQISNYFSLSLAYRKNTDEVLWDVAKNLIGRLGYEDCMIYLWNSDKTKMLQRAGYGLKDSPEKISAQLFEVEPGQGVVGYVMQTKEPVIISDTRIDMRYRVDDMQRLSEICVPIIHDGKLLGIIDSENSAAHFYKERDLQILTTIATLTGNKIKQVESERVLAVKKKELVTINEQLAEAQLAALQAQMNPHFIFNALNSIKRMILDDEKEKASRYLSKFAQLIRLTLNHSKETFVTLKENVEYLKAYLEMEQLRFKEMFTSTIEMDESIDDDETGIPSLMIQPLVENAVWHGLLQKQGEKKITIRFSRNHQYIICSIEDNGIGIRQSEAMKKLQQPNHKSVGLENLRKRIEIMNEKFDMDCSLSLTDLHETDAKTSGTLALLQFKSRDFT
jgi:ligand-binding sensor domain-containing protein/putative methionine-R-sulfoxide reductase with GAF domain